MDMPPVYLLFAMTVKGQTLSEMMDELHA